MAELIKSSPYPVARSTPIPPAKTPGPYVPTSRLEKVALGVFSVVAGSPYASKVLVTPPPLEEVWKELSELSGGGEEIHHFIAVLCPYLAQILEKSLHESSGIHSAKVFACEFLDAVMPHIFLNAARKAHERHKHISRHALLADVIGQFTLVASVHCNRIYMELRKNPEPLTREHFIPFSTAILKICFPEGHLDLPFPLGMRKAAWIKLNLELPDILQSFYMDLNVSGDTIFRTQEMIFTKVGQTLAALLRNEGEKHSRLADLLASEIVKELQTPSEHEKCLQKWLTVQLGFMACDHRKQLANFWYFIVRYIVPTLPATLKDALSTKLNNTTNFFL